MAGMKSTLSLAVIIPALNGARELRVLLPMLARDVEADRVWVIDSSSDDDTVSVCRSAGVNVRVIDRDSFNHGGTRKWARSLVTADALVYMTQDALPAQPDALSRLVARLEDPSIAIAYGRQLPRPGSDALEAFPRLFNYPDRNAVKSKADLPQLGIKTFFCSNSFCAYRTDAWDAVGGFPDDVLIWEDQHIAARLIAKGFSIAYVAEAQVYHSHRYSLAREFRRYFDTGAFLRSEEWMRELGGEAEGEGVRLVREQAAYLHSVGLVHLVPYSLLAAAAKYAGYRLGHFAPYLPRAVKRHFSLHPRFW